MYLKVQDLKRIANWFDIAEAKLDDEDLVLYDNIRDYLGDAEEVDDGELVLYEGIDDYEYIDDYDDDDYDDAA